MIDFFSDMNKKDDQLPFLVEVSVVLFLGKNDDYLGT
jgi:hypothetical protein